MTQPSWRDFEKMPTSEVADFLKKRGNIVLVYWLNGTRRWLLSRLAQNAALSDSSTATAYAELVTQQFVDVLDLLYSHGIHTIICPAITMPNLKRGDAYIDDYLLSSIEHFLLSEQLETLITKHDLFITDYGEMDEVLNVDQKVRVDLARDRVRVLSQKRAKSRLFVGFCAADSANAALIACRSLINKGLNLKDLTRNALVKEYYGENIERVHLAISHGRMSAHSTPFMMAGEDMYFQTSPSLYLSESSLRRVLFDYLFSRNIDDLNYDSVPTVSWEWIGKYYEQNKNEIVGLGRRSVDGKIWAINGADQSSLRVREEIFGAIE